LGEIKHELGANVSACKLESPAEKLFFFFFSRQITTTPEKGTRDAR